MKPPSSQAIAKAPTGIAGFDEITYGGLPKGASTLVTGGPGCGKTLFALSTLFHGAQTHGENGLYLSFQERPQRLQAVSRSVGLQLEALLAAGQLSIDHIHYGAAHIDEGKYDALDGLFMRMEEQLDRSQARRVVIDSIDALFGLLQNRAVVRQELRRLLAWLEEKQVTAILIGEKHYSDGIIPEMLDHFACDCVIALDNRVENEATTRRLRILKYRGSKHGPNEYPFLLSDKGLTVMPLSSITLDYPVSSERISTGLDRLDDMLGGEGFFRGSVLLLSGTAGAGKTTFANSIVDAACGRGEKCLYLAMEESQHQILRNLKSVGYELQQHLDSDLLHFHPSRPVNMVFEESLAEVYAICEDFRPSLMVIDPMTHISKAGTKQQASSYLMRLTSYLKGLGITVILTDLIHHGNSREETSNDLSSFIDIWILLKTVEASGERNNTIQVLKSRGSWHSRQLREFRFREDGISILDVYAGPTGVLTGVDRVIQEEKDRAFLQAQEREIARLKQERERQQSLFEARMTGLRADFDSQLAEIERKSEAASMDLAEAQQERNRLARLRGADETPPAKQKEP